MDLYSTHPPQPECARSGTISNMPLCPIVNCFVSLLQVDISFLEIINISHSQWWTKQGGDYFSVKSVIIFCFQTGHYDENPGKRGERIWIVITANKSNNLFEEVKLWSKFVRWSTHLRWRPVKYQTQLNASRLFSIASFVLAPFWKEDPSKCFPLNRNIINKHNLSYGPFCWRPW